MKMRLTRITAVVFALATACAGLGCESILGLTPGKRLCEGITCPAKDACHLPGTCDEGTGQCSNPVAMDKTPCDDGNACTLGDACRDGACTGDPKACALPEACHTAVACDPTTGQCSASVPVDQGPCDDGDPCTIGDACHSGSCVPGAPKTCAAQDVCHFKGVCDKATGMCSNPIVPANTKCAEEDECSLGGTCNDGGTCVLVPVDGAEGRHCDLGCTNTQVSSCREGKCVDRTWASWNMKESPSAPRYEKRGLAVFDKVTHLTWEPAPDSKDMKWDDAQAYCTELSISGYTKEWRLPTRIELASIVDYSRSAPAIDLGFFVGESAHYWTSSQRPDKPGQYWAVSFVHGYVGTDDHKSSLKVRCVR